MGIMKRPKKSTKSLTRWHGYGKCQGHRKTGRKCGAGITTNWKKSMKSKLLQQQKLGFPNIGKKLENPWKYGKHGFKRPLKTRRIYEVRPINIGELNSMIDKWVEDGLATRKGDTYEVDLSRVGYNKLLARGAVTKKINVKVRKASVYAVEEIENAGGSVTVQIQNKKLA